MFNILRLLLLVVGLTSFFTSTSASAAYWWDFNTGRFDSPAAGCASQWLPVYDQYKLSAGGVQFSANGTGVSCVFSTSGVLGLVYGQGVRGGTGCDSGTAYDSSTGSCKPTDTCAARKDQSIASFTFKSSSDLPPAVTSINGCAALVGKAKCYYESVGNAVCNGTATYTGTQLAAETTSTSYECNAGDCFSGKPEPQRTKEDCVYVSNGGGKQSCSATSFESNPGIAQCGTVNGAMTCIENPRATSVKDVLQSVKDSVSNPNGTLTVVKDNTVTTVSCSGRNCTTTVTTSKGTTVTDSSGNVVSNGSSCSGTGCSSSGEAGTGSHSGSGTGSSGSGTGNTEDPAQQGGQTTTTLKEPGKGNFDSAGTEWDGKINDAKKALTDGVEKLKDSFSPLKDLNLSSGGKLYCPPPAVVLGKSISFCIDQYASDLSWISAAVLLICACIALMIVFT